MRTPVAVRDFFHVAAPQPHPATTKRLLAAHPELRALVGTNTWSVAITAALAVAQTGIALLLARLDAPWWGILLAAWTVGATLDHALWVMIHEATHNMMSRRRWINQIAGYAANAPMIVPGFAYFQMYHLRHHGYQGEFAEDADLPNEFEARTVGNSALGKALWLLVFPLWQSFRPLHLSHAHLLNPAALLNFATQAAFLALLLVVSDATAVLYLVASLFFALGLHPFGARWIQEHFTLTPEQETYSYYGSGNVVAFNVGFHNEHHDFPSVPWNRLPRVRAIAAGHYDGLVSHRSWSRLLLQFIFDQRFSLYSRVIRPSRRAA